MDAESSMNNSGLLLLGVGLAIGLSLAALIVSVARLRGVVMERRPRWPRAGWVVVPVFGAALIAIGALWTLSRPSYQATAVLRISPTSPKVVFNLDPNQQIYSQQFVNTEKAVITSPVVLERVLDRADVRETEWYKDQAAHMRTGTAEFLDRLLADLDVRARRETELIDVSMSAANPADAKLLADSVLTEYRRLKDDVDKQSGTQVKETLTTEQATLQMEIDGLLKTRFNIANRLGTDKPELLRTALSQRANDLDAKIHEKQRDLELKRREVASLDSTSTRPEGAAQAASSAQVGSAVERMKVEIELLTKDLDREQKRVAEAGEIAQEISSYDERIRQKRDFYEAVRQRREQLEIEDKAPARVRVVAYATEPTRPNHDRRPPVTLGILAAAALLSLLLLAVRPTIAVTDRKAGSTESQP